MTILPQREPNRPPGDGPESSLCGRIAWLILYAANLIAPLNFAAGLLQPAGWYGLVAGVLLLAWCGERSLRRRPRWVRPAVIGAALVATTQLMPLLQMAAGIIALTATRRILQLPDRMTDYSVGPWAGGLATIITGLELLAVSLAAGKIVAALLDAIRFILRAIAGGPAKPKARGIWDELR